MVVTLSDETTWTEEETRDLVREVRSHGLLTDEQRDELMELVAEGHAEVSLDILLALLGAN